MDEQSMRRKRNIIRFVFIGLLVFFLGFTLYTALVTKKITIVYKVVMAGGILLIWLLQHIVAPRMLNEFQGKTAVQMDAYKKMAGLSLLGYLGLVYFALSADSHTGFYGALVYLFSIMFRRRFTDVYNKTPEEIAREEAENAAAQEEEAKGSGDVMQMDASTRLQRLMSTVDTDEDPADEDQETPQLTDGTTADTEEAPADTEEAPAEAAAEAAVEVSDQVQEELNGPV